MKLSIYVKALIIVLCSLLKNKNRKDFALGKSGQELRQNQDE